MKLCIIYSIVSLVLTVSTFGGCGSPENSQPASPSITSDSGSSSSRSEQPSTGELSSATHQSAAAAPTTEAFAGKVAEIPGTIEAENFNEGKPGVAYSDQDEKNLGAKDYRGPTQVDIEQRDDASGGFGVGWTRTGEWLAYTIRVKETGIYDLQIPVASDKQGGTFHLEFNGKDVTGPIDVPDTGGWENLQTISIEGLQLQKGVQEMKLVMDVQGGSGSIGDIDCLRFTAQPQ
ncbi:MAG: carbohydrate-binding protein [Pirellulales bacterium]